VRQAPVSGVPGAVVPVCLRSSGIGRVVDPQERADDRGPAPGQGVRGGRADAVVSASDDRGVPGLGGAGVGEHPRQYARGRLRSATS